jgi:hypothetical protein
MFSEESLFRSREMKGINEDYRRKQEEKYKECD